MRKLFLTLVLWPTLAFAGADYTTITKFELVGGVNDCTPEKRIGAFHPYNVMTCDVGKLFWIHVQTPDIQIVDQHVLMEVTALATDTNPSRGICWQAASAVCSTAGQCNYDTMPYGNATYFGVLTPSSSPANKPRIASTELPLYLSSLGAGCSSGANGCNNKPAMFPILRVACNDTCTGLTTPFSCCTGAGTGTCVDATNASAFNVRLRFEDF